ncbi:MULTISPECIES: type VI secretion system tube protein Hcp [unclassified Caballeronia]|uniref:Hcp family type VI secretion system effector n=1 Tax=unclassified Caballeronia TaxID=2646786 RepID=UPI00285BCD2F|nr:MULTISPECIES: type VI secretion system tube protein Hcp [unclassified Caballeronia]MDR5817922.1 type VI secretion system tube protein Hcp [Caballeronia sp. LZ033]MDR5824883.1 type VI secretion system tube protein Hcp [Caballeronia sp. LZ043]MDR5882761.1 type VI secretion system tube protein Hcp [Caballeronia sp. LZ032]
MSGDIFVDIDGIDGESPDAMHPRAIQASSWNWDIRQNAANTSGSGGGASKATVGDLTFIHQIDRASPNLAVYCFNGTRIRQVKLTLRKAGGVPFEYFRITLGDVVITHVSPAGGGSMAIETVSLSFTTMKQEYFPQSITGGTMGAVTAVIDLRQFR